jgi:translation initiation factor 2 alpha subunit (eIF-2alpha)
MKIEKIVSDLVRPLVLSGAYKDETVALKDIVVTHIESKMETYNKVIQTLQEKYGKDFDTFTKDIKNKATPELEDDWMEWKEAIEMKKAWNEALREVIESEAKV